MEKFNKEKALTGEPVRLKNGCKAFVKFELMKTESTYQRLHGFFIDTNGIYVHLNWNEQGRYSIHPHCLDIAGMYAEKDDFVNIKLAKPLNAITVIEGERVFYLSGRGIESFIFNKRLIGHSLMLSSGELFKTADGALSWKELRKKVQGK
ncbi:hypothetical protein ACFSAV_07610 [Pasteurella oralis]|uniref:Uncharacterized protein n=1 Tax=Pasteurella oralis TaxID=1071947 RepID=A0ABW4NYP0_9PAST|nr:hypothetical protein [Pasteurella multocida]HED4406681.1 hypothetical protein [Pasteurella multocida]